MKKTVANIGLCLVAGSMMVMGCKKKTIDPVIELPTEYTVPETYNFTDIDTVASKQSIQMLGELTAYIRTTHSATSAPILDPQKLKDMFANVSSHFSTSTLNSAAGLKSKTEANFALAIESNFNGVFDASTTAATKPTETTAKNGVAGKMINGTRYILVDTAGIEYKEFAEKGLMNAVLYYNSAKILNAIASFDNTTKTNGTTAQEKAWDQAFANFGVPVNFPTFDAADKITGTKNWGGYCNSVSAALSDKTTTAEKNSDPNSLNRAIMKAWITGRAAITNKDDATRNAAVTSVLTNWEKVIAGRFITYTKGALANATIPANYHHNLSEAIGFIDAFAYNTSKSITDAEISALKAYFKTGGSVNLYTVTTTNLNNAVAKMAFLFGLDATKL